MVDLTGQLVGERYRVDAFLGRGGMADVYKVWDQQRAVFLALKVLHADLAEDKVFLRRFEHEAQTLEALQHPNIVRFYGLEKAENKAFILMDYINGLTLRKEIFLNKDGLPDERILEVLRPVCAALYYAHRMGRLHCDIKPGNIMIHRNGTVYLTDFGIARVTEASTVTPAGPVGTPAYMAPEQLDGKTPTPTADIYSLGVVLYEMVTGGERPFTGEAAKTKGSTTQRIVWEKHHLEAPSPRKYRPDISPAIETVIMRCLERNPKQRFATTLDLLQALEGAVQESTSGGFPNDDLETHVETIKQTRRAVEALNASLKGTEKPPETPAGTKKPAKKTGSAENAGVMAPPAKVTPSAPIKAVASTEASAPAKPAAKAAGNSGKGSSGGAAGEAEDRSARGKPAAKNAATLGVAAQSATASNAAAPGAAPGAAAWDAAAWDVAAKNASAWGERAKEAQIPGESADTAQRGIRNALARLRRMHLAPVLIGAALLIAVMALALKAYPVQAPEGVTGSAGMSTGAAVLSTSLAAANRTATPPAGATPSAGERATSAAATQSAEITGGASSTLPTPSVAAHATPDASANAPIGGSGRIAFVSDRGGSLQIWTMDPADPDNPMKRDQITSEPLGACQPAWSPDGAQIAYTTPCKGPAIYYSGATIKIVRLADKSVTDLPLKGAGSFDPTWSADGQTLAYTAIVGQNSEVRAINLQTKAVTTLANRGTKNAQPAFSPDGESLVYVTSDDHHTDALWLMRKNGDSQEIFSNDGAYSEPAWTPDGSQVLVSERRGSGTPQLMLIDRDTPLEGGKWVFKESFRMAHASVSPDGQWVVFWSDKVKNNAEIFLARLDGSGTVRQLTSNNQQDFHPAWSPK